MRVWSYVGWQAAGGEGGEGYGVGMWEGWVGACRVAGGGAG